MKEQGWQEWVCPHRIWGAGFRATGAVPRARDDRWGRGAGTPLCTTRKKEVSEAGEGRRKEEVL